MFSKSPPCPDGGPLGSQVSLTALSLKNVGTLSVTLSRICHHTVVTTITKAASEFRPESIGVETQPCVQLAEDLFMTSRCPRMKTEVPYVASHMDCAQPLVQTAQAPSWSLEEPCPHVPQTFAHPFSLLGPLCLCPLLNFLLLTLLTPSPGSALVPCGLSCSEPSENQSSHWYH